MKKLTIIAVLALAACGPTTLSDQEKTNAEMGGLAYANSSNLTYVSCSGQDSDKDGYVTCSFARKPGNGVQAGNEEALCAYRSRGCKRKG